MESSILWIIVAVLVVVVLAVLVTLRRRRAGRVLIARPAKSNGRKVNR